MAARILAANSRVHPSCALTSESPSFSTSIACLIAETVAIVGPLRRKGGSPWQPAQRAPGETDSPGQGSGQPGPDYQHPVQRGQPGIRPQRENVVFLLGPTRRLRGARPLRSDAPAVLHAVVGPRVLRGTLLASEAAHAPY